MAVAYQTDNEASGNFATSVTTPSITIAGSDRVVIGGVHYSNTTLSSVSGGGASWAAVSGASGSNGSRLAAIWRGIAPTTGGQTFTATFGNADGTNLALSAIQYTGADQTTPAQNGTTATGSSGDPSVTVSSVAADDYVSDCVAHGNINAAGTNQTAAMNTNYGGASYQDGADGGVMSWTQWEDLSWIIAACRVVAASGGGGGRTVLNTRSNPLGVHVGMGWRMPA